MFEMPYDEELREQLRPKIIESLLSVKPDAAFADVGVDDAFESPRLYASLILDADGYRLEEADPEAEENKALNSLIELDEDTLNSWDGYGFYLDLRKGIEIDPFELMSLCKD